MRVGVSKPREGGIKYGAVRRQKARFFEKKNCLGEEAGFGVRVVGYCQCGTIMCLRGLSEFFLLLSLFFFGMYVLHTIFVVSPRLATQMTDITTLY